MDLKSLYIRNGTGITYHLSFPSVLDRKDKFLFITAYEGKKQITMHGEKRILPI